MKKILILSDIHGHCEMAAAIAARHPDLDFTLVAGDLTNFGDADDARAVVDLLPRPLAAVAGNCDGASVRRFLAASGLDLEGRILELPFATIVGAGGGLKRAGITSFERTESQLRDALEPRLRNAAARGRGLPIIVVTHTPPYGTNADRRGEKHVGSAELESLMVEFSPAVWICGHIHESRSVSREEDTLLVNPGPCGSGSCAVLELRETRGGGFSAAAELFA